MRSEHFHAGFNTRTGVMGGAFNLTSSEIWLSEQDYQALQILRGKLVKSFPPNCIKLNVLYIFKLHQFRKGKCQNPPKLGDCHAARRAIATRNDRHLVSHVRFFVRMSVHSKLTHFKLDSILLAGKFALIHITGT